MIEEMYTVREVAYFLRRSEAAIRMLKWRGKIKSEGSGKLLFKKSEVQRFLNNKDKITRQDIDDLAGKDYIADRIRKNKK